MNNRLYWHLYLHLKNTLKKSTDRGTRELVCHRKNVRKTPEEERNFKKKT